MRNRQSSLKFLCIVKLDADRADLSTSPIWSIRINGLAKNEPMRGGSNEFETQGLFADLWTRTTDFHDI